MPLKIQRAEKLRAYPSYAELDRKLEIEGRHLNNDKHKAGMRHKNNQVYLIMEIVDYDKKRGYLRQFEGFSDNERTWELFKNLLKNSFEDLRKMMKAARERAS